MPPPTLPPASPIPSTDLLTFLFTNPPPNPGKPLFTTAAHPEISYTWSQALDLIKHLIAGLYAQPSFSPGCTVVVHSLNSALYPILILSIIGAGGVFAGTNPTYTSHELNHALRVTRARFVLCEPEPNTLKPILQAMEANSLDPATDLMILDLLPMQSVPPATVKLTSWRALLSHGVRTWTTFNSPEKSQSSVAALFLSSGTTGLPKPVALTHHNLVAQHTLIYQPYFHLRDPNSPTCLPSHKSSGTAWIATIPLFHIGISNLTFVTSVAENRTVVIMRKFETEVFLENFEKWGCNEFLIVPPIVNALTLYASKGPAEHGRVTAAMSAAPLGAEAQKKLQVFMGGVRGKAMFGQLWGMTELSCIASFVPPDPALVGDYEVQGSVGWTAPGLEMHAFDPETLRRVADGNEGEIWVRGPTVMRGYFGDENRRVNEEAFVDDAGGRGKWLRSGDLGRRDPKTGLWWIVGRVKELIKVRGFQVGPSEVEDVIRSLAGIADVAVAGVDPMRKGDGEIPRAYVVRTSDGNGERLTVRSVQEWVEGRLSRYKWLDGGVLFVHAIPRNASGKILRRVLKEMQGGEGAGGKLSKL